MRGDKDHITPEQREEISALISRMHTIAVPVGPLHAWWDIIFDMEAFIGGRQTILNKSAQDWIDYASERLGDRL